jgi:5'-nucleotidase
MKVSHWAAIVLIAFGGLTACSSGNHLDQPFELNIAHINDSHSNIRPPDMQSITLEGTTYFAEQGGFSRLVSLFNRLHAPNLLKLHAGDAMTGTYFYNLFEGETDAIAMNSICFDAFIPGNHEFDYSDAGLKKFLDFMSQKEPACQTPVLAANVHPATGSPLDRRPNGRPYFQPYLIKEMGGVPIGIVGIDVKGKTQNASKPLPSTVFDDEATAAQKTIDLLKLKGVRHIVLMTHVGYDKDLELASQLTDVDVIIGGDSHTFLGQKSQVLGKAPVGPYPTIVKNKSGEDVCIGQAWEYTKVFARMKVLFKPDGSVLSCAGTAAIVVGDQIYRDRRKQVPLSATENSEVLQKISKYPEIAVAAEDSDFSKRIASFNATHDAKTKTTIGALKADQSLCLVRVPGENWGGSICDPVAANAGGSDMAQVVAEGYRRAAQLANASEADFALTNAGGVRVTLETDGTKDGVLIMEDVFRVQPFPNELIAVQITGAQIQTALEQGVANWLDKGNSNGSHPYASGLRWDLDLTKPAGARFSNLQVKNHTTGLWSHLDPAAVYKLIIADYLRDGYEGYSTFSDICKAPASTLCIPLGGVYAADSLARHLQSFSGGLVVRPACTDYSHQKFMGKNGMALNPPATPYCN